MNRFDGLGKFILFYSRFCFSFMCRAETVAKRVFLGYCIISLFIPAALIHRLIGLSLLENFLHTAGKSFTVGVSAVRPRVYRLVWLLQLCTRTVCILYSLYFCQIHRQTKTPSGIPEGVNLWPELFNHAGNFSCKIVGLLLDALALCKAGEAFDGDVRAELLGYVSDISADCAVE